MRLFLESAGTCVRFAFVAAGPEAEKKSAMPRLPRDEGAEVAGAGVEKTDREETVAEVDDAELVWIVAGSENLASTCWGTKKRPSPPAARATGGC